MKHIILLLFIIFFVPSIGAIILGSFYYIKGKQSILKYLIYSDLFLSAYVILDILNYYFAINLLDYPESFRVFIMLGLLVTSIGLVYYLTQFAFEITRKNFNKFNKNTYYIFSIIALVGMSVLYILYKQRVFDYYFTLHIGFFMSNIFIALGSTYNILLIHVNREKISLAIRGTMDVVVKIIFILIPTSIVLNVINYNVKFDYPIPLSPVASFFVNFFAIYFARKVFLSEKIENQMKQLPWDEDNHKKIFKDYLREYNITERELEIIELVLEGLSNQKIGETLFISPNTVKNHIYNIYKKMDIKNRYELIALLSQKNLYTTMDKNSS